MIESFAKFSRVFFFFVSLPYKIASSCLSCLILQPSKMALVVFLHFFFDKLQAGGALFRPMNVMVHPSMTV